MFGSTVTRRAMVLLWLVAGCGDGASDPIDPFLPSLPPTGGAALAAAGRLTDGNYASERVPGPASQGLVGDYYLRNDKLRVILQAPGRAIAPCPYGGTVIDVDRIPGPGDQLGEVAPFLQLGRTVDLQHAEIVRDGSAGGPAVIRFRGHDVVDDYINVPGIGGFAGGIQNDYRPDVDLGLEVAVTYVLAPGDDKLQIFYTLYNSRAVDEQTSFGTITDTGAQIEIYHPGIGYGELTLADALDATTIPRVEYAVLQGQGQAYGLLPIVDGKPGARGGMMPIAGVDVEVHDLPGSLFDLFGGAGQTLQLPSRKGVTREVDLLVADDAAGILTAVLKRRGAPAGTLTAVGPDTLPGLPEGSRLAILDPAVDPKASSVTSFANGFGQALLPPGRYRAELDGPSGRSGGQDLTITAGATTRIQYDAAPSVPLGYTIKDRAGKLIPGKISVVGAWPAPPDRRFRDVTKDPLPFGLAAWLASKDGTSLANTRWDHPLLLAPGRYRVVIGRGPEWSRFEQTIDVVAYTPAHVDAVLDRVIDTAGYLACDFHQHTHISPDSPVPPEDRIVTYLADGIDVVSTSEHDVHLDYEPFIAALGAGGMLDAMVGVEVTPFDYGHFIGYPLPVDPRSPNGGAVDWGGGGALDLAPREIFKALRTLGAQVVQVNHPRAAPGSDVTATFQQTFDRAALTFDFAGHSFGGGATLPVTQRELGLPDGAQLFSPEFDALEVYNGTTYRVVSDGIERTDPITDANLRDYMNFLSFGFTPTAVGDSDSHGWVSAPAGLPRTMVRVPDDSAAAIAGGGAPADVVRTVAGARPRDVVVTNGPMLGLAVNGAAIGGLAPPRGASIDVAVRVQTPAWAPVDTVEIFANATFDEPLGRGAKPAPLFPALCFTSRPMPSPRCAQAIGGARPLAFASVPVGGAARLEANLTATVDLDALLARNRTGAVGRDLWLLARATGDVALFPTIPLGLSDRADVDAFVAGAPISGAGIPALAFTNPVFVDGDGGGFRAPFAP